MSEAKRVPLQTLEFPESLGHATKKEKKGNVGKQLAPSFRFTLTLPESNEKTCPEFNYAQLLKTAEVSSMRLTRFCHDGEGRSRDRMSIPSRAEHTGRGRKIARVSVDGMYRGRQRLQEGTRNSRGIRQTATMSASRVADAIVNCHAARFARPPYAPNSRSHLYTYKDLPDVFGIVEMSEKQFSDRFAVSAEPNPRGVNVYRGPDICTLSRGRHALNCTRKTVRLSLGRRGVLRAVLLLVKCL